MAINVLVLDDSAVMRAMIIKTLKLSGIPLGAVYEAADGKSGFDVIKSCPIDLALIDINMPKMNGEELLRHMQQDQDTRATAALVVSTETGKARIERITASGAGFIHKPFTPERLRDEIRKITGVPDESFHSAVAASYDGPDF